MANPNPDARGPLSGADYVRLDGVEFWGAIALPAIDAADDDIPHVISETDTCVRLSTRYYGTPTRDHIIKRRNDLYFDVSNLIPGDLVYIPTLASLKARGLL